MLQDIRKRLAEAEDQSRRLRNERHRAAEVEKAAIAAIRDDDEASLAAAEKASQARKQVEQEAEELQELKLRLLKQIGDAEAGMAGFTSPGVSGWDEAARTLSLAEGRLRADVTAQSLLAAVTLPPSPVTPGSPLSVPVSPGTPLGQPGTGLASNRWAYPVLPAVPIPEAGGVVATDFVLAYDEAQLTGGLGAGVERDPDAVTLKETMTATVSLAEPKVRMFAAVLEGVPSRIFDSQQAVRQLLGIELSRQLSESFDSYCVGVIEDATPPSGSTGSDLVSKIRNAISDMHDLGGEPTVICLSPSDAAALDLHVDAGQDGGYLFVASGATGEQAVWRLLVREVPSISAPTLVDAQRLGVIYQGEASILLDPFGANLATNQISCRVEAEAVMHVRDIQQGAYQIA